MIDTPQTTPPRSRRGRPPARIHGVLPLNKSAGMTSFDAVRQVRRIFGERRVGHAGTLDPSATGLLPICIGQATRLVDFLHQQPKRYHCVVRLGERSDTMDLEGTVTRVADASHVTEPAVRAALVRFEGDVAQVPPMHSAVRKDGRHLYELAREGIEVEREPRTVHIASIRVLAFRPGPVAEVELDVVSGKGAYMRVLASDLGDLLGTGGLLSWLERTAYGPMSIPSSVTLEQLEAMDDPGSELLGPDVAVSFMPRVDLPPQLAVQVRRGQSVWLAKLPDPRPRGVVRAHGADGDLICVGELTGTMLRPTKVLASGGA
ncbi:MAG TPA: tRNA pseudouridine(55) synthase TruB [Candidatus Dormibacteraeota bacterium]|nr:tRNA pseudouridine(55) synthase TruB [Candidatus Dormibacteraeota bacterium]